MLLSIREETTRIRFANIFHRKEELIMRSDSFLRRLFILAIPLIVFLFFAGCASTIKKRSEVSLRHTDFTNEALNREGLAILPVIILEETLKKTDEADVEVPPAPYAQPIPTKEKREEKKVITHDAYRVIMNEVLMSKIKSRRPFLRIVSPSDALKRLNDAGMIDDYQKFNSDFPKVGFNSIILRKFGETLNSRYLLISQVVVTESKSDASVVIIWTFGRKSVLRSVKISGQVWDATTGRQMWEGLGIGYNRLLSYESTPLLEEIAGGAVESLLNNIMP